MSDEFFDDKDEALDYVLYKKMEKEDKQPPQPPHQNGGCLSLVLFLLIPPAGLYVLIDLAM